MGEVEKNMIKKIIGMFVCTLLIITVFPVVGLSEDNEIIRVKTTLNEADEISTIRCNVYDTTSRRLTKHQVSEEEIQKIIDLIQDEISQESFIEQIEEKLNVLNDIGIIDPETASELSNIFKLKQIYINQNYQRSNKNQLFEVVNIFSGIFFGMKGVKEYTLYELIQFTIPFLIGNMTAGFTVMNRFRGNGSVFSIGFLGVKNIHDYDETKYEDPFLPTISGSMVGFTGVLIEVLPEEEFKYYIGAGMTMATVWNKLN